MTRQVEKYKVLRYRDPTGRVVRVREHKMLAELEAGRRARIVHHVDGDKDNNDPKNLWVFDSQKEHMASHKTLDNLLPALLESGVIEFDRTTATYKVRLPHV